MARTIGSYGPKTLEAIRKAGLRLIFEHGYAAMSLRDLAAEVGIQVGSLYNHISTKQELLFDLVQDHVNALLGQLELKNQQNDKAEEAFSKAVDLDKNNVPAFLMLARAQVAKGSVDQAIAGYQRAMQSNPRDVRIYISLASLLETRGDWQQAEDLYKKALAIQPDYPVAANNLSYLMLEHGGDVSVALTLAQTARKGLPDLASTADTLGWAYYNQGAYTSAIDTLKEAVKQTPDSATFHYHLGMAYEKANNHALAKKELEQALQISPNYSEANKIRKILAE